MAALLSSEIGNTDKIVMYIAECKDMGIPGAAARHQRKRAAISIPPAARSASACWRSAMSARAPSGPSWSIRKQHGRFRSLFQFCEEVDSRVVNKRVLESLIKSGALDSLGWKRSQCMAMVDAAIEHGQKAQRDRESGQKGLFAGLTAGQAAMPEPAPPDIPEWPLEQLLAFEKETLGLLCLRPSAGPFCRGGLPGSARKARRADQ